MADVIYSYTRADAIADGVFVDLMEYPEIVELIREAGFRLPFCATTDVVAECIGTRKDDGALAGESWKGRLWDLLNVLRMTLPKDFTGPNEHWFKLSVSGEVKELIADFTFDEHGKPAVTLCYVHER